MLFVLTFKGADGGKRVLMRERERMPMTEATVLSVTAFDLRFDPDYIAFRRSGGDFYRAPRHTGVDLTIEKVE